MLHIINAFESVTRGSENAALEAARRLAQDMPVAVWSTVRPPDAVLARARSSGIEIQTVQPFAGRFPKGGALLIWGTHFDPGVWLAASRGESVAIVNELFNFTNLYQRVLQVRAAGLPAPTILHVSSLLREAACLDGPVRYPPAELAGLLAFARRQDRSRVVVGRLSRDTPEKHHADDPLLYRALVAEGLGVRLLGATVLAAALRERAHIELLPEGAESPAEFLASIDIFFYRTGGEGILVETSGLVIAEAMAAGLPVVAALPGGFADLIEHGENGFLVDSQEQAYDHVLRLAADAALRASIGSAARARVAEYFGRDYTGRLLGALGLRA